MQKFIYIIILFIISCQAQHKESSNKQNDKNDAEYFIGTWRLTEKNYEDGNGREVYPLHECAKKYTWYFEQNQGQFLLTKNYFTGKDCSVKSSSERYPVEIENSTISYMDIDLKRAERYKVLSANKFSIEYGDILKGKVRNIQDVYERQ